MLAYKLINPPIINALAMAGHGAKVLIADSNYPASTKIGPNADLVYLNLSPGLPSGTDVLQTLLNAIEIEAAMVMQPDSGPEPDIFDEFSKVLPKGIELQKLGRFDFYDAVSDPDTCLVIQTGEQRLYANILLVIGAIAP
ncbi:MAG: RbsD/FucU family protein [Planctomycetota bacterium]|nr:MAG: RbsD/FucU family protein [Planctomycetota bacterium]